MFQEILKITPKLDSAALSQMERSLNSRFGRVAKTFGKGLLSVVKGGGLLGAGLALIDKLLNPLKETREAIDRTLNVADDVTTNAEQFNTTPGQLFKLQKLAQAKGLDADGLNNLLVKYQGAIAEAAADPKKETAVRQYANDTDMAESFLQFMQNLNSMDRKQQVVVQQEVFGEKQTLKMAEFLRADFQALNKRLGLKDAAEYNPALNKLDTLGDKATEGTAAIDANDIFAKSKRINEGMINERLQADRLEKQRENERIASYNNLQALSNTSTQIQILVEKGVNQIGSFINFVTPAVNRMVDAVEKFSKSGLIRGIFGGKDK